MVGAAPALDALLGKKEDNVAVHASPAVPAADAAKADSVTSATQPQPSASDESTEETSSISKSSTSASEKEQDAARLNRLKRLLENQEVSAINFNENVPLVPVHGRLAAVGLDEPASSSSTSTSHSSSSADDAPSFKEIAAAYRAEEALLASSPLERSKRNRVSRTVQMHVVGAQPIQLPTLQILTELQHFSN